MTDTAQIEAVDLGRDFGDHVVVDRLDLCVDSGEIYGFLGPNGAGKTTTIRMLAGLLVPSRGSVVIGGETAREPAAQRRVQSRIGFVPDTPPLYDHLTPRQYAAFCCSLYGIDPESRRSVIERGLEALDLTARADDLCKTFSHGMRKKVHLVAMLSLETPVLLLDEPTTGLDPQSHHRLKELLRERRAAGTAIFLSTHILETASDLCDRLGILARGRLKSEGTLDEIRARSKHDSLEEIFLELVDGRDDDDVADNVHDDIAGATS